MPNPVPTLIYNSEPNTIPLRIALPNGTMLPLLPGITLAFRLLASDGTGNYGETLSPLGTCALGPDGSSVVVTPTATGQFGFAMLETVAGPTNREGATLTVYLFLLFVDQLTTIIYDTAHITGGPLQH